MIYDQFKQDSTSSAFTNMGLGVDYKPTPNIVHKFEYYKQQNDSAQSTAGLANGDETLQYQFIYFYN